MSAPHIAGIVAQLVEANPSLTPAQIEDLLEDTADPFGPADGWEIDPANPDALASFDRGHGLVDAAAAVAEVGGLPQPPDPAPTLVSVEPDGTVRFGEPEYSFTGGPVTSVNYSTWGCDGLPTDAGFVPRSDGCHREYVEVVVPPGGATLRVEIAPDLPDLTNPMISINDLDLHVRGPDGSAAGSSTRVGSSIETVITPVAESGIYTILVVGYTTVESTFHGTVTLGG